MPFESLKIQQKLSQKFFLLKNSIKKSYFLGHIIIYSNVYG